MIELDATNAVGYLRQVGWLDEPATARALGWGVSNAVVRVDMPRGAIVLKQSRPQLRTREPWFSDLDRIFREAAMMRTLQRFLPSGVVPTVLFEDRDNYLFAMTAVPSHSVWKEVLLAGEVDLAIGRLAGEILGTIHRASVGDAQIASEFDDYEVFVQLRIEPFYWRMKPRHPDLGAAMDQIIDEMFHTRVALVHADFSPKNLLVHSSSVTLVDYETGHWGDPAFDLGFFLSHLILKSIKNQSQRRRYYDLTRAFWDGYADQYRKSPADDVRLSISDLTRRSIGHFALCCLARVDGTSPVEYLAGEDQRESVRRLARQVLDNSTCCWETVLETAQSVGEALGQHQLDRRAER